MSGSTRDQVIALLEQGYSQAEAARYLGVSKQDVFYHKKQAGYETYHALVREYMPWGDDLSGDAIKATPYARLYDHVRYELTNGEGMPQYKIDRLQTWYSRLEKMGVVVEYDPSIPPLPGQQYGHWRYAPREERDGRLIIRQNDFTKLSAAMKNMFRFPETLPGA